MDSGEKMSKVVLGYSGGLDTSVAIKWLQDKYSLEVIAVTVDLGQPENMKEVKEKAEDLGAKCYVTDAKKEFVEDYVFPSLKANAMYEDAYPLSTAVGRPLIAKLLVDIARKEGAEYIAHGCTAKGNDQVRFDVSVMALAPEMKIIAPMREWIDTREEKIAYAKQHNIPVPVKKGTPYSIDENLWGRSIECGVLEDPGVEPPEEIYSWTSSPETSPDTPCYMEIYFEKGIPKSLDGKPYEPVDLINTLNHLAGVHGVGRIDHVENRLVGIKSREVYECPAATVLLTAHKALEYLTLPGDLLHFKKHLELKYSEQIYYGLWFSPLREALTSFFEKVQESVTGCVTLKLFKGSAIVVARESDQSLYSEGLSTYANGDMFNHSAAEGFIYIWGLPLKVSALAKCKTGINPTGKKISGETGSNLNFGLNGNQHMVKGGS